MNDLPNSGPPVLQRTERNLGFRDVDWVAEQLGVDKNTVYRYLNDGRIPGLQIGKKWLVEEQALREWLRREQKLQTERRQATAWAESQPGEPGNVAVLFTDIAGASQMVDRLGDKGWHRLVSLHNQIVLGQLPEGGHSEPRNLGDGFMVAFEDAAEALTTAISIQRAFAEYNASTAEPVQLRIGVHYGPAIREGDSFQGKTLFQAARITGLAAGGQILASAAVKEQVEGRGSFRFGPSREVELERLSGRHQVFEVPWEG